jgi:cytochrome c-type biogenesis protein CcmH/NrfG
VTLAEICAAQGHLAQAVAILERLLRENPGDERVRERLRSLRPRGSDATAT